nr:PQQ-binding-like beta-propeller repeat protein [Allomuricauda sp.]
MRTVHSNLKIRLLLLTVCYVTFTFSQQKIEFDSGINGQIINGYTGTLLVKTRKGLFGIDPKTKQVSWKNMDLKKVDLSEYSEVPYTSIVIFTQKPLISSKAISNTFNSRGKAKTILNVVTGHVLFDSDSEGFKAVNHTMILPQKKGVLVDGVKDKDLMISLFNYETGQQVWETKGIESNFFENTKGVFFDDEKILLDTREDIYWLKNKQLIKIDGDTGEVLFERADVTSMAMNASKDILFVFSNKLGAKKLGEENAITALDVKTNTVVWKDPIKIWGNISDTAFEENTMVVITSKGFNVIDVENGTKKWERSEPLPLIKKIVPVEEGYLVVQDNYLVRINDMGKKGWGKKLRITHSFQENPVYLLEDGQEILYITPSKANRVNIENGTKVWEKDIVLNSNGFIGRNLRLSEHHFGVWNDTVNKLFPVYAGNSFYIFDQESSKAPVAIDTFNFKRTLPNLKIRDKGYLLYHLNQFYFYDLSGRQLYNKSYPYPEKNNLFSETFYWTKRGFGTYTSALGFAGNQIAKTFNSVLVSTDLGPLSTATSNIYGTYLTYRASLENVTELNQMDFDLLNMSAVLNRINTSRKNEGLLLIVALREEETEIIELDIDSGEEESLKTVGYTYSDFAVDQIERQVYFFDKKIVFIEALNN